MRLLSNAAMNPRAVSFDRSYAAGEGPAIGCRYLRVKLDGSELSSFHVRADMVKREVIGFEVFHGAELVASIWEPEAVIGGFQPGDRICFFDSLAGEVRWGEFAGYDPLERMLDVAPDGEDAYVRIAFRDVLEWRCGDPAARKRYESVSMLGN
jgi:uncharacterized protein (DUF2237 family)